MWPDVLSRVEQGESLRQIAKGYGVSYETIRRTVKAAHKRERRGK
jgi:transposase